MKLLKLLLLLLLPMVGFSQNAILKKVQRAQIQQDRALDYQLFKNVSDDLASRNVDANELRKGLVFTPDFSAIAQVKADRGNLISLAMPLPERGEVNLTLVKHKLLTDDFLLNTNDGFMKYSPGAYYHGIIEGDENSLVAISLFENEIIGFVSTQGANYVIGKLKKDPSAHVIYNDYDLLTTSSFSCDTPDDNVAYRPEDLVFDENARTVGDCIRLYIEIDNDIVNQKGGAAAATNYITGLFNENVTLYANESLEMGISEIFAWTSTSPYSSTSSSGMLSDFQANTGAINGDLGHLVSYQASGGIAAGFSGICNSNIDNSKCFSSIDATYASVPTYSWSVMVTTHEMGHLIGSRHTHACVWNGNNTAIDGCSGSTEGSCALPGNPSGGGTIMSYCHLQSVGINLANGFGPQPGNVIRNTVANASCLPANCGAPGPSCSDGIQNGNETGVDCGGPDCPACPTPCTDNALTLSITLDNYPEETSWTVTNAGGGVVASGGTYGSSPDGSTITEEICLVDGCYDFTINDSYGDGICCGYGNGSYTLSGPSGVLAAGGAFGSSETTNFCLGAGPTPTCTDGVQNGNETGVDCGGPDCPACPTCTDGVQNGNETGVDCGGPDCPACPSCNDGVQNGNETGVDCGGPDCPACPTCNDGVQNGNETGVDCGGPDCPACPPGGTTTLFANFFETGWDGWIDGGSDCYRYNGSRSYEGTRSIRIRDNSGTASSMTKGNIDLTSYSSVDVTFFFYPNSMENGEDFWLRFYDGSSWSTVAAWASGTSFTNNSFWTTTVTISAAQYNFASNSGFRFQCDASANADRVYIDAVTVVANSGSLVNETGIIATTKVSDDTPAPVIDYTAELSPELAPMEVNFWPNPTTDMVTIQAGTEMQNVRIVNMNGQLMKSVELNTTRGDIDVSNLDSGIYYLLIEVNGEIVPQKLIKI